MLCPESSPNQQTKQITCLNMHCKYIVCTQINNVESVSLAKPRKAKKNGSVRIGLQIWEKYRRSLSLNPQTA